MDVTHAGVRVRCESAGLENLERTFWRDDAEAGDGDAEDGSLRRRFRRRTRENERVFGR